MYQHGLAGLQFRIVEQHVLHGGERDRRAGGVTVGHAIRHRNDEALAQIHQLASEAVDMEAHDAGDVLAQIVAALFAGLAFAAGQRAVHHDFLAGLEAGHACAGGDDLAGGFRADDQRHLALGERHAAIAPDVDVVERDRLDADLHLAGRRRRRGRQIFDHQLAVGNEGQCAHGGEGPRICGSDDMTSLRAKRSNRDVLCQELDCFVGFASSQ